MRKIYVTGLGVISGIGKGVEENLDSLKAGKHGMGKITLFPTALDVPVSEVKQSNEELKKLLSLPSGEIAHAGKKKVLRTFLFHHLELTRKEFRVSEVINHMPAFHVVAGIAICTPHCAANDDIHVLNLIFDTNTHDFCHSSRFFLMRSRHSSNRVISSSEKPL